MEWFAPLDVVFEEVPNMKALCAAILAVAACDPYEESTDLTARALEDQPPGSIAAIAAPPKPEGNVYVLPGGKTPAVLSWDESLGKVKVFSVAAESVCHLGLCRACTTKAPCSPPPAGYPPLPAMKGTVPLSLPPLARGGYYLVQSTGLAPGGGEPLSAAKIAPRETVTTRTTLAIVWPPDPTEPCIPDEGKKEVAGPFHNYDYGPCKIPPVNPVIAD
jgi:hypothetical protein